jgi:hypothetical protein
MHPNLYHYLSLGKILLQVITNWYCRFSRHFPRKNVRANGILQYVQAYLDDLLCISRSSLEDNLEKLEEVLKHLCDAGFKANTENLAFCALKTEYLGYILTRDGINPQSNKVQAILTIKLPKGVIQLQHFLGMVQYYRHLWARQSNMLPPLTSLVGECSQTKVTKAKGTKKSALALGQGPSKSF